MLYDYIYRDNSFVASVISGITLIKITELIGSNHKIKIIERIVNQNGSSTWYITTYSPAKSLIDRLIGYFK